MQAARTLPLAVRPGIHRGLLWFAICIAAYIVYAALALVLSLRSSAAELNEALALMRHGRMQASAADSLADAWARAHSARVAAADPLLGLVAVGPLNDDLAALDALAAASTGTAEAALDLVGATSGWASPSALYEDGRLHLDRFDDLRIAIGDAEAALRDVTEDLAAAPTPTLFPLSESLTAAQQRLASAVGSLERTGVMVDAVPALAGADGKRTYLLAFQSPSEARASGGLFGMYGVVTADEGRFELVTTGAVDELNASLRGGVGAPRWFSSAYGPLSALDDLRQTGLSPTFPVVGETWLEMYESATGKALDGVIAMDPVVLGKLTRATGPIQAPGWDVSVNKANARRVLLRDAYTHFGRWGERAQTRYLRGLVDVLWSRLSSGEVKVGALATAIGQAIETRHLKIYARDDTVGGALSLAGADGDPRALGQNVQMLFNNNWSASKIDFLLQRELETEVWVRTDGSARVRTAATLTNRAEPRNTPLTRSGIRRGLPAGHNEMTIGLLMPLGARLIDVGAAGVSVEADLDKEAGRPLASFDVTLGADRTTTIVYDYVVPDFVTEGSVRFTIYPQATVRPDAFQLSIHPPTGYRFVELDGDDPLTRSGVVKIPKTLTGELALD